MRVFFKLLLVLAIILPIHSCFGPFNPDDPGMGMLPGDEDTSKTNPKTPVTMIAWWKCDDTTNFVNSADYKGLKGEIQEGVSFDTGVGGTGYSLAFKKDTYVNVFDDSTLNFKNEDFTISLWCKPAQSNDPSILMSKGKDSSLTGFVIELSGNYPAVKVKGITQKISDTLQLGTWNHLVFTREKGAMSLYLNAKKYQIGSESAYISNVNPLRIGAAYENVNYYRGNIDEIKIESEPWSENKIRTEYARFRK